MSGAARQEGGKNRLLQMAALAIAEGKIQLKRIINKVRGQEASAETAGSIARQTTLELINVLNDEKTLNYLASRYDSPLG